MMKELKSRVPSSFTYEWVYDVFLSFEERILARVLQKTFIMPFVKKEPTLSES
jgi:hypothetical protein